MNEAAAKAAALRAGAWALTAVLALGAAFPAAAGLRRLPGFRSVL